VPPYSGYIPTRPGGFIITTIRASILTGTVKVAQLPLKPFKKGGKREGTQLFTEKGFLLLVMWDDELVCLFHFMPSVLPFVHWIINSNY
jgi:hypothetical protein